MTLHGFTIISTFLIFTYEVYSQVDTVIFTLEPLYKNARYEYAENYRDSLPHEIIVLNCDGDTLGKHSSNTQKTNSDTYVIQVDNYDLHDFRMDITSRCEFKFGKKHGEQVDYYEFNKIQGNCIYSNTLIKVRGTWKNDMKHGTWTYYRPDGQVEKIITYKKGEKIKTEPNNR